MTLLVGFASVLAVASVLYALLTARLGDRSQRDGRWSVETVTRPGGTLEVLLVRAGSEHARTVRELPPGINTIELASELRLAREDAAMQAAELNNAVEYAGGR